MYLKKLHIRNFRNIADEIVEFSEKLNIFIGENAQGKSNLLEAIYFLSTAKSFRGSTIDELIAYDKSYFCLEAEIKKNGLSEHLKIYYDGKKRKITYNDTAFYIFSQLLGILPSVLLVPQDLQLIMGYPAIRRKFINVHIAQCDPLYIYYLSRYTKAMKHRNALFKVKEMPGIEVFESQMASSGKYIIEQRIKASIELQRAFNKYYLEISSKDDQMQFKYLPSCKTDEILALMQKNKNKEMLLKSTFYGPHRDDFSLMLNNKNAKSFASEGQKRTILAALKFAELERLCQLSDDKVIFGIDDFSVHLDKIRQNLLLDKVSKLQQVIITSPIESNLTSGKKFLVRAGKFKEI